MGDYIVIGAVVVPAVLLLVLRSSAVLTFLSLCLGSVLALTAASDTADVLGSFAPGGAGVSLRYVALGLLLLPPLLTGMLMARSVKKQQLFLQFIPALGVGVAGLLLSKPWLTPALQDQIEQAALWPKLDALQVGVVGFTALVCLLAVWMQRPKPAVDKHAQH